ncbi:MAG: D-aminoacylase [Clostridiales bacterium]|nr:D-aminoacylase [Clostridiales bacterium]
MSYNLIIKGGKIIDGTGKKRYRGCLAIKDGKIAKIAPVIDDASEITIDAGGKVVSPGFIDPHAHNDGYIFMDPSNSYKLFQGVTTEISGNCGEGLVPVSDEYFSEICEYYRPYYPADDFNTYKTGAVFYGKIDGLPLGNNIGFLCAHGTLRMSVMGFSAKAADSSRLELMKKRLAECMESGALGMSTGLVYSPGCFADTEELIELCKVVHQYNGIYCTHLRSEGYGLIDSVNEAIRIARESKVRTVISHLKALGRNYWGLSAKIIELIESARADGIDIYCDQYPYTTSCTVLHWVIPIEYTTGGFVKMCQRLSDPAERQHIKDMYANKFGLWDNLMENITPSGIHVLKADKTPDAVGKTIQGYADSMGADPHDALFDVIVANKADSIAAFDCMSEDDVKYIMKRHEYCMVGSDGIDVLPKEKNHPRLTGAFPRVLGKYVRQEAVLSLETAVKKMTSLPAKVVGIPNKGILKKGFDADICIFDEDRIIDKGTLDDFNIKPEGIEWVIVNGKIALADGQYTGTASGRRITKQGGAS